LLGPEKQHLFHLVGEKNGHRVEEGIRLEKCGNTKNVMGHGGGEFGDAIAGKRGFKAKVEKGLIWGGKKRSGKEITSVGGGEGGEKLSQQGGGKKLQKRFRPKLEATSICIGTKQLYQRELR